MFGFLHSSKLLALQHEDILHRSEGYLIIIKASKTDPCKYGVTVKLTFYGDSSYCTGPLAGNVSRQGLIFCFKKGTPLTRRHLNTLIRELASHSQKCPQYSFRNRGVSSVAAAGIPDWKI